MFCLLPANCFPSWDKEGNRGRRCLAAVAQVPVPDCALYKDGTIPAASCELVDPADHVRDPCTDGAGHQLHAAAPHATTQRVTHVQVRLLFPTGIVSREKQLLKGQENVESIVLCLRWWVLKFCACLLLIFVSLLLWFIFFYFIYTLPFWLVLLLWLLDQSLLFRGGPTSISFILGEGTVVSFLL